MDIVYRRGRVSAAEVLHELPDPPGNSAVRTALRLLEEKGLLSHEQEGQRYVYFPTVPQETARVSALRHLIRTFFNGSAAQVVNALVEETSVSAAELDRIAAMIEQVRKEGA